VGTMEKTLVSGLHTDACRVWTKQKHRKYGYGSVHRIIYEYVYGEIPEGFEIHHKCNNPLCFNPEHLEALSQAQHFALRKRTHCLRGHELTADNVYWSKGKRACKKCKAAYCAAYHRAHREQYAAYTRACVARKKARCQS